MSTWEPKVETPNKRFQYLIMAAEPYEIVAFKIQSREVDRRDGKLWTIWDRTSSFPLILRTNTNVCVADTNQYSL